MNAKRLSMAFVIALAVSALCTWLLGRKMGTHAADRVPDQRYVAPIKPLQPGEILKAENLELVNWPAGNPIAGAYVKLDDLVGRSVIYPVDKDQPITDKFLSAPGSGLGLSAKIPDGMRAIALRSDEVMGVAGFIFPGSHLDVLATYHVGNAPDPITITVLQDAEVLAVGQKAQPDPEGKPVTATVVTLLLTPEDAQRAVMASSQGTFHFVLRSGSDKLQVKDRPITLANMSGTWDTSRSTGAVSPDHHTSMGRTISVETIAGDKASTDTFGGGR